MAGARGGEGNTGSKWHERAVLSESRVTGASVRAIEFAPRLFGLKLVRPLYMHKKAVLTFSLPGGTIFRLVFAHLRLPRAAQPRDMDGGDRD
jgi:hypothetical protein